MKPKRKPASVQIIIESEDHHSSNFADYIAKHGALCELAQAQAIASTGAVVTKRGGIQPYDYAFESQRRRYDIDTKATARSQTNPANSKKEANKLNELLDDPEKRPPPRKFIVVERRISETQYISEIHGGIREQVDAATRLASKRYGSLGYLSTPEGRKQHGAWIMAQVRRRKNQAKNVAIQEEQAEDLASVYGDGALHAKLSKKLGRPVGIVKAKLETQAEARAEARKVIDAQAKEIDALRAELAKHRGH